MFCFILGDIISEDNSGCSGTMCVHGVVEPYDNGCGTNGGKR